MNVRATQRTIVMQMPLAQIPSVRTCVPVILVTKETELIARVSDLSLSGVYVTDTYSFGIYSV